MAIPNENGVFDPVMMSADLATVRGIIRTFFSQIEEGDWERPTESRPKGWTLKQAFCHIAAVAELFANAIEDVLERGTFFPPILNRKGLAAYNQKQIEQRQDLPPEYLLHAFLDNLSRTEGLLEDVSEADLEKLIPLNVYNRPLTLAELVGHQLVHPTIVHGAQLANGIGAAPLWTHFSADFMYRQLCRFFRVFSHAYWPERGGDLTAVINFNIRDDGGGRWHVKLDIDGGTVGEGYGERPAGLWSGLTLHFANPHTFCSVFTTQLSPVKGFFTGKVFAWGNIPLAFKLPRYFTPT